MDIILAMAMFAFFFPLSLVFFIFKDASSAPGWMKKLGSDLGSGQIKKLVNAIISVAATILTYTIIMMIIGGFLRDSNIDPNSIQNSSESLFNFDLDNSTAMEITVAGTIVLVYVINYIADQIPNVTKKILDAFGVKQEDSLSKEMGENVLKLTNLVANEVKTLAKNVINPEAAKAQGGTK
jgi:predicted PurR-regulated permease PerM